MTAKILVSCLLFIGCAAGQDKPAPQRGLLEFKLVTLSKSERGDALTAAVTVTNKTAFTYFLMLLGKPHAVDDSGGEYDVVQSVDGVAYCKGYDSYHGDQTLESVCVGTNPKDGAFVPPERYTEIEPDASAVFTIVLHGRHSDGKQITLTQKLVGRVVKDADADQNLPEAAKLKSLRFKSMVFNAKLQEVVSSTINFGPVK
jgi:hypothetical protein